MDIDQSLHFAQTITRQAGLATLQLFRKDTEFDYKYEKTIVTKADLDSENIIINAIKSEYPSHSILAEESGSNPVGNEWTWIIDPLDGTTNYAAGYPFFGISVALQHYTDTVLGVVYDPVHDEMFYAKRGSGAFLNDEPIHVRKNRKLQELILSADIVLFEGKREQIIKCVQEFSKRVRGIKILGSAVLNFAYIASGRFDVYISNVLRPWDLAASLLILKEAGGVYTSFDNQAIDIFNFNSIICSNDLLHSSLLEIINSAI